MAMRFVRGQMVKRVPSRVGWAGAVVWRRILVRELLSVFARSILHDN